MNIQNKSEAGMSFVELMIAGLLLLIVALMASTTFMSGSRTIIKSWDESVAVARAQELLEEINGIRYEYIYQATSISASIDNIHLNVINPIIMPSGSKTIDIPIRVIAHDKDQYVVVGYNNLGVGSFTWKTGTLSTDGVLDLSNGNAATITLTTNSITIRTYGTLSITVGGNSDSQRIMLFPEMGEVIKEKDMIGTITLGEIDSQGKLVNRPLFIDDITDDKWPTDIFPEDYKQITITTSWGKAGSQQDDKSVSRQLVTIVAPKPKKYYEP